jgi:hypothetical protein
MVQEPKSLNIVCLLILFSVVRHLNVDENCTLLSYYAASNDKSLPTFRDNPSKTPEGETDGLSQKNVRKELRLYDA